MNSNILNYSGPLLITKGVSLVMHASNKDLEKEEFYFCMLETISHGLVLRLSKMLFLTRELMGIKHAWTKRIRTFTSDLPNISKHFSNTVRRASKDHTNFCDHFPENVRRLPTIP